MNEKCLYPECKLQVTTRGLCSRHYQAARMVIRQKLATWEQLEAAGKCLSSQFRSGNNAQSWFAEAAKTKRP